MPYEQPSETKLRLWQQDNPTLLGRRLVGGWRRLVDLFGSGGGFGGEAVPNAPGTDAGAYGTSMPKSCQGWAPLTTRRVGCRPKPGPMPPADRAHRGRPG